MRSCSNSREGMVRQGSSKQIIQMGGNWGLFHQGTPAAFPGLFQISYARLPGSAQQGTERSFLKSISIRSTFFPPRPGKGQVHGEIGLPFPEQVDVIRTLRGFPAFSSERATMRSASRETFDNSEGSSKFTTISWFFSFRSLRGSSPYTEWRSGLLFPSGALRWSPASRRLRTGPREWPVRQESHHRILGTLGSRGRCRPAHRPPSAHCLP